MSPLDLTIGILELTVALVVLGASRRFRNVGWLAVFAAFFALRGIDRLIVWTLDGKTATIGAIVDSALAAVLLLLVLVLRHGFGTIERLFDVAQEREREYSRALVDYRRVARHRLATPVTAIVGSAQALNDLPELDRATRKRLLETILTEARRLERVVLDPETPLAPEERGLSPMPHVHADPDEPAR